MLCYGIYMDVVMPYFAAQAAVVLFAWLQENWKLGTRLKDLTLHGLGMVWIAMMRHTGEPRYCHQPRRYRAR